MKTDKRLINLSHSHIAVSPPLHLPKMAIYPFVSIGKDGGAYLERKTAGLQRVTVQTDQESTDFTNYRWGYQVGLVGERSQIFTDKGADGEIKWCDLSHNHQPLTWYKTIFDAPEGDDPIALNLASMGRGEAWVNGESIGRYWVSFHTADGSPSQSW
ncbi:hypothetical protein Cgig2_012013 [Carnegiea gigantea]|uniref:Beta-galactosidase galactose-binding domain-containing protein n=1 Tax=Carnegiea gigantea TaxID=171969 RepID=A0A9Q1KQV5_9CARY|nr:hypothetical protein Cgig2_012013 [Carnegiea gigantea]